MITNDKYDFFFFHIPKCGGTSTRRQLMTVKGSTERYNGSLHYKHTEIRFLPPIPQTNVFTVVRNPWERFHSLYWDCRNRLGILSGRKDLVKWYREMHAQAMDMTFSEWIMNATYIHPKEWRYNEKPINTLDKSQLYYVEGCDRIRFFTADKMENVDAYIEQLTGTRTNITGSKINSSNRPHHYHDAYDDESRKHVAKVAAPEIAKFAFTY